MQSISRKVKWFLKSRMQFPGKISPGKSLGCYQTAGNEGETAFYLEFCKTLTQSPLSLCLCVYD